MAIATSTVLEQGIPLAVGDQTAETTAAPADLRNLRFTDNFSYSMFAALAKPAGTAGRPLQDVKAGKTAGAATDHSLLYSQAYLTTGGWLRCDESVPLSGTAGSPNRSTFCNASETVGFTAQTSIEGRLMTDVVTEQQANTATNVINNGASTTGLLSALGAAKFPAGSFINAHTSLNVSRSIFINSISTDARPDTENTLEQLIAKRPAVGTGSGSLSLGLGSGDLKNLRVGFSGTTSTTAGAVQFYECDLDSTLTVTSNCHTTTTGTYDIGTINGVRVLRFAGNPNTVMNHTRLFVEVKNAPGVTAGDKVFLARQPKPDVDSNLSTSNRLNSVANEAIRAQLGI
jgi:hypothetical protein